MKGEELGNKIENGKMMFIYQAQLSFKIWHNILPKIDYETIKLLGGQTTSFIKNTLSYIYLKITITNYFFSLYIFSKSTSLWICMFFTPACLNK